MYSLGDSDSLLSQLVEYLLACSSPIRVRKLVSCLGRQFLLHGDMKNRTQGCTVVFYKLRQLKQGSLLILVLSYRHCVEYEPDISVFLFCNCRA